METSVSFKMLVMLYRTIWHHISKAVIFTAAATRLKFLIEEMCTCRDCNHFLWQKMSRRWGVCTCINLDWPHIALL
jgi:hypothetical protein